MSLHLVQTSPHGRTVDTASHEAPSFGPSHSEPEEQSDGSWGLIGDLLCIAAVCVAVFIGVIVSVA